MKKPNDIKQPNSRSGSLGALYRRRSRFLHVSVSYQMIEVTDPITGITSNKIVPKLPHGITYKVDRNKAKRERRRANAQRLVALRN